MNDALDVVGLFRFAFAGTLLTALACGLLGVHVVARRMVTAGLALPQVAAFGIALGLVALSHADGHSAHAVEAGLPHVVALVCEVIAVLIIAWPRARAAVGQAAIAGMLFAGAGAVTVLVMAHSALGMEEVHHLVEGNVLAVGRADVVVLASVLIPVIVALALGSRRLISCTFDPEMAATLGVRVRLWQTLFYACFVVTAAVAVHAAGTLFVFSFLVLPGAAGVVLGRSGAGAMIVSAIVAVGGATLGFVASASAWDTPTGPTCAAAVLVLFLGCFALAAVRQRLTPG